MKKVFFSIGFLALFYSCNDNKINSSHFSIKSENNKNSLNERLGDIGQLLGNELLVDLNQLESTLAEIDGYLSAYKEGEDLEKFRDLALRLNKINSELENFSDLFSDNKLDQYFDSKYSEVNEERGIFNDRNLYFKLIGKNPLLEELKEVIKKFPKVVITQIISSIWQQDFIYTYHLPPSEVNSSPRTFPYLTTFIEKNLTNFNTIEGFKYQKKNNELRITMPLAIVHALEDGSLQAYMLRNLKNSENLDTEAFLYELAELIAVALIEEKVKYRLPYLNGIFFPLDGFESDPYREKEYEGDDMDYYETDEDDLEYVDVPLDLEKDCPGITEGYYKTKHKLKRIELLKSHLKDFLKEKIFDILIIRILELQADMKEN